MDAMQDPIHCPHGGECFVLEDGSEFWPHPCPQRVCDNQAVAPSQRKPTSQRLSA